MENKKITFNSEEECESWKIKTLNKASDNCDSYNYDERKRYFVSSANDELELTCVSTKTSYQYIYSYFCGGYFIYKIAHENCGYCGPGQVGTIYLI